MPEQTYAGNTHPLPAGSGGGGLGVCVCVGRWQRALSGAAPSTGPPLETRTCQSPTRTSILRGKEYVR